MPSSEAPIGVIRERLREAEAKLAASELARGEAERELAATVAWLERGCPIFLEGSGDIARPLLGDVGRMAVK